VVALGGLHPLVRPLVAQLGQGDEGLGHARHPHDLVEKRRDGERWRREVLRGGKGRCRGEEKARGDYMYVT